MESTLRYFLPSYFIVYFGLCFLWRTLMVWRKTGINPLVLGNSDSVYDYVGRQFKLTIALAAGSVAVYAISFDAYHYLVPISFLEKDALRLIGCLILGASFIWTYFAQLQMKSSWRIGIDQKNKTDLVSRGLFRFSRNPIFVGMILTVTGLFFCIPSAVTLLVVALGVVLIQVQVRLEEDHLTKLHGDAYRRYCGKVRRWI